MNRARSLNKYYIKQYVINDISCQEWMTANWDELSKDNKIIGYMFTKQAINAFTEGHILNLYLLNRQHNSPTEISKEKFTSDWELFLLSCKTSNKVYVYVNPPVENWLDTKGNWCRKVASELSNSFKVTYEDALSTVYYNVMLCYNAKDIYMGNLNYIKQHIINYMLNDLKRKRCRVNQDSGLAISMNTPIGCDNDGKEITIEDTLYEEEYEDEESLGYQSTLECCKRVMSDRFSPREIDSIIQFNGSQTFLPRETYAKLIRWRAEHTPEEVLNK